MFLKTTYTVQQITSYKFKVPKKQERKEITLTEKKLRIPCKMWAKILRLIINYDCVFIYKVLKMFSTLISMHNYSKKNLNPKGMGIETMAFRTLGGHLSIHWSWATRTHWEQGHLTEVS